VLHRDADVMQKIAIAQAAGRPVDGHAPGLRADDAAHYASAGISTDHECFTAAEARDKLAVGMKVLIREGSAARNFDALIELLPEHHAHLMFCSDDKHPDTLVLGHINQLVQRAVALGNDVFQVLRVACVNPVKHYNLPVGLLGEGDPADFIVVKDLRDFEVLQTYLNGVLVAENGQSLLPAAPVAVVNNFKAKYICPEDFQVRVPNSTGQHPIVKVIQCFDGQLITARQDLPATVENGLVEPDVAQDVLKLAVVNRYEVAPSPSVSFIRGFGLKEGALASSVGHDSHNITVVGCDDESMARAVFLVMEAKGGLAAVGANSARNDREILVPLPVAGLMSDQPGTNVAEAYAAVDALAKELGSPLGAPFMTLSFMALLVIPDLKLSDKGLFDGQQFAFVDAVE
jgi:adenine deaminase